GLPGMLLVLSSPAIFLGSVVWDWAYFGELGMGFADIPTSLADHVRSGLLWLPATTLMVILAFLNELVTRRIEGWRTETELITTSSHPVFIRRFRNSVPVLFGVLGYTIAALYVLLGDRFRQGLWLALLVIWSHLVWWLTFRPPRSTGRTFGIAFFVVWVAG